MPDRDKVLQEVKTLYFDIINMWCRFHDYLLMFMQIDLGREQAVLEAVSNKQSQIAPQEKVLKKLKIIQPAKLQEDIQSIKHSGLVTLAMQSPNAISLQSFPQKSIQYAFKQFYQRIDVQRVCDSSQPDTLKANVEAFKKRIGEKWIAGLPEGPIRSDQIIDRLRSIKRALRYERELIGNHTCAYAPQERMT